MQQETGSSSNPSSQILPLVVAAFVGATLAIACERPDSRVAVPSVQERVTAGRAGTTVRPEAPMAEAPVAEAQAQAPVSAAVDALNYTVISGRIKAGILTDPAMAGSDISVNTDQGVVSLTGTVKSHEQTGIASGHAQRQDGVMRVDSHISVNPQ